MARRHQASHGLPSQAVPRSANDENSGHPTRLEIWLIRRLLEAIGAENEVEFVTWDGKTVATEQEEAGGRQIVGRVHLRDRGALWRLLWDPTLAFGDLYSAGRVTVYGDLVGVLEAVIGGSGVGGWYTRLRRFLQRAAWLPAPSLSSSRDNIHHHYDVGNDFYRLWLDTEAMQYTCAYYPERVMTLEAAQRAKMDHVCQKLRLRPGEAVVEAGSGWGGLALHMARHYGVTVRAFNISSEQIDYSRAQARRQGLSDRVEFVHDDYRSIADQRGANHFDVFVSIGMLEHVGPGNYRQLGRVIERCLAPDGRGLIHTIGRDHADRLQPWIERRIFPGAYPPTLGQMMTIFEPAGLSVLDVENLRLHYGATLREWLARFERQEDRVTALFDRRFVRAWRLYLAGSVAAFRVGTLQLFQVLFARSGCNDVPRTRRHLYAGGESETW